jgi:lysophospholipase L1-like esterase
MERRISRHFSNNTIGLFFVIIFGVCLFGIIFNINKQENEKQSNFIATLQSSAIEKTATKEAEKIIETARQKATIEAEEITKKREQERLDLIKERIVESFPGIICWGDSLTAGAHGNGTTYPKVLEALIAKNVYPNIQVTNCGIGGENTNTIIGRAGSVPYIISTSFTIPSDTTQVKIKFASSNGSSVAPLRQGDCGVNPVIINGISGQIKIEQESSTSKEFSYFFSRSSPGKVVDVEVGTEIITSGSLLYNNYIPVIFIGQNGGWNGIDDLISQQNSIVNSQKKIQDKYLILGLSSGDAIGRTDLEKAMLSYYGDKYINLRKYLSSDGIVDAGLKPTDQDIEAMKIGSVPPSLLSDSVHLNSSGYSLVGKLVFERMVKLGYFDDVVEIIKKKE